jgi:hypothetical protein
VAISAALSVILVASGGVLLATAGIAIPFAMLLLTIVVMTAARESALMTASLRRLEEIVTRIAERRGRDAESQRLLAHELKRRSPRCAASRNSSADSN